MNDRKTPTEDWTDCPTGQIGRMKQDIAQRRRKVTAGRAVAVLILLVAACSPFLMSFSSPLPSAPAGGITCDKVHEHARAWLAGSLERPVAEKIEVHLQKCPHCPKFVEQLRLKNDQTSVAVSNQRLLAAAR